MVLIGLSLMLCGHAEPRDLEAEIATAQSRASVASSEVDDLRSTVAPIRLRLADAQHHAAPARKRANKARAAVAETKRELRARRAHAARMVERIERERSDAAAKHRQRVDFDLGLAIAALLTAMIALGWSWFRASDAVAALTRLPLAKAAAAALGGGVLVLIAGSFMKEAGGAIAVVGGLIFGLGFALPVALLLARHSAEVQRGRSKALFGRERMSPRVTGALAGTFGALLLIALVAAATDGTAGSRAVTGTLRDRAKLASLSTPKLKVDEQRVDAFRQALRPLQEALHEKRADFDAAQRKLRQAEARLADAQGDERSWTRKLEASLAREERQRERAERQAQQEQEGEEREYQKALEREEREAAHATALAEKAEACDPNYVGQCLHEGIGDYDCAGGSGDGPNYVYGPVEVVGVDEFGLDSDGDGIGCEDG